MIFKQITFLAAVCVVILRFLKNKEARENLVNFIKTKEKKYMLYCINLLKNIGFDTILKLCLMTVSGTYISIKLLWDELISFKQQKGA